MKKFLIALLLAGVALAGRAQITPATALSINLGTRNLQNSQGDALGFNVPGNWPAVFLSGSSLTFNSGSTLTVNSGATVSGLVSQLVAGSGITLSPSGGQGVVTVSASGGLPGGSNTQLQYNNSGVFGGTSGLTWSGTGLALAASGAISVFDLSNANVGGDSLIRFTNDQGARLYSAVLGSTFAGTTAGISNNNLALITTSQTGGTYPSALMFGTGNGAPVYLMANNTNYIKLDGAGNTSLPLLTTNGVVTTNSGIGNLASTTSLSGIAVSGAAGSFTTLSASSTVGGAGFSTLFNSPPPIGQVAPNPGAFTTLSASNTVSGTGFSNYLASPPAIGGTAPNTVAATTLSASSTVSGTGFSTYLASPPAIGGTAPAAGAFTTLSASSTVSGTGFSTYLASPPAIGGTAPSTGAFTTLSATGAFTPAQVAGIVGTTTNNNAQAGSVGEYMQTLVVAASEVALTNNTSANMCSMSLTAGDWDISGLVMFDVGATTNFTEMYAWATTTSAQTLTLAVLNTATVAAHSYPVGGSVLSNIVALTLPPTRFSLSATTTVYLVAMSRFTVSTAAVFGGFRARRVR